MKLPQDQIESFAKEGFLQLESITSEADVATLRVSYDRIFDDQAGRDTGRYLDLAGTDEEGAKPKLPQILGPATYAPEMNDSELLKNATEIAHQLLGEDAGCSFAHAILKPAGDGAATPWHQDAAYWDPNLIARSISIWVPLQAVDVENGCMQFVPGSHLLDVLPHRSIGNDPRVHGLELDPSAMSHTERSAVCPIPAGGCTIHGGYMLHHAGPNLSDGTRRALILMAFADGTPRDEPIRFPWQEAWVSESKAKREAGVPMKTGQPQSD